MPPHRNKVQSQLSLFKRERERESVLILVAVLHNSKLFLCWGGALLVYTCRSMSDMRKLLCEANCDLSCYFFPDLVTNQGSSWILCDYFSVTLNYLT